MQQGGGGDARGKPWRGGRRDTAGASKQSAVGQRELKRSSGRKARVWDRSQRSLLEVVRMVLLVVIGESRQACRKKGKIADGRWIKAAIERERERDREREVERSLIRMLIDVKEPMFLVLGREESQVGSAAPSRSRKTVWTVVGVM